MIALSTRPLPAPHVRCSVTLPFMPVRRIHEVARAMGLPSKVVLLYLRAVGHERATASSRLSNDHQRQLASVRIVDIKRVAREQASVERRSLVSARWWDIDDDGWLPDRWIGPDTLTTNEAAAAIGVVPSTIRQWVRRGHLRPAGHRGRAYIFGTQDVLDAAVAVDARNQQPGGPGQREHQPWHHDRGVVVAGRRGRPSDLIDAAEAAATAAVAPSTIRAWVGRGHLSAAAHDGRRPLYLRQDVLRAARRTPHRTRRKPPVF